MTIGITVDNLSFMYGKEVILKDVSFGVPIGQIWALVGRSGVGKTTLLQIIAGLFEPVTGSVLVHERPRNGPGRIKGVMFQDDSLLGWLNVERNILFPRDTEKLIETKLRSHQILAEVGLAGRETNLPMTLSTGMRKRVEFARALFADDRYLLADEAFSTLDALTRRDLWRLWQQLREKQPRTGLLCTHDPEEAIRLCDVVIPLVPGPPAKLGEAFEVPKSLSSLPLNQTSEELFTLKERLIGALSP
jgi:ABC-type nitrate/sulfonate/bicarbonate transport system ATPase subunit